MKKDTILIQATLEIEEEHYSIDQFFLKYPKARINSIDGVDVIGQCESCDEIILEGNKYFAWEDSVLHCFGCGGEDENHKPVND